MILDIIKLVLNDIWRRKFSSFLTFLAISLGIMLVFIIILLGQGFQDSVKAQFDELGVNQIYVSSSAQSLTSTSVTKGLSDSELDLIKGRPYVSEAYGLYFRSAQIGIGNNFYLNSVIGSSSLDEDFFNAFNVDLDQGRFPRSNEKYVAVVGSKVAEDLFGKKLGLGSNMVIKGSKFKIVGILDSIGNDQDDSSIYLPIDTIRDLFEDGDNIGFINVIVDENYDVNLAKDNLLVLLENKLGEDSVDVRTLEQLFEQFNQIITIIQYVLTGIALVSLVVGGFGIINTMYVIITEKTKEIGIMKAIGATNGLILSMYVFYSGAFGILGFVLATIIVLILIPILNYIFIIAGMNFVSVKFDFLVALIMLLFSFSIGAIAGFLPSYKASRFKIVETFRK